MAARPAPHWSLASGEHAPDNMQVVHQRLHSLFDLMLEPKKRNPDVVLELETGWNIQAHRTVLSTAGRGFSRIFKDDESHLVVLPVTGLRDGQCALKAFVEFAYCGDIRPCAMRGAHKEDLAKLAEEFGVWDLQQWLTAHDELHGELPSPPLHPCNPLSQEGADSSPGSMQKDGSRQKYGEEAHENDGRKRKRLENDDLVMALDLGSSSVRAMAFSVTEKGDIQPLNRHNGTGQVRFTFLGACAWQLESLRVFVCADVHVLICVSRLS
jgi:hypothetical protein